MVGLLDRLRARSPKTQLIVIVPKATGPLIDALNGRGVQVIPLLLPNLLLKANRKSLFLSLLKLVAGTPQLLSYLSKLQSTLKQIQPQRVYSNGLKCHLMLGILSSKLPYSITFHLRDILASSVMRSLLKSFCQSKNSEWLSNSFATQKSLEPIPSKVIHNGIDPDDLKTSKKLSLRASLGLKPEDQLIGMIGILTPWKGQELLLRAAERLLKQSSHYHFVFAGDDIYDTSKSSYKTELIKKAKELSIDQNVHFLGFVTPPAAFYAEVDMIVHASIRPEPFGRVIVESMMMHTPFVASAAGGVLEIVPDSYKHHLFRQGSVEELSRKIPQALTSSHDELQLNFRQATERFGPANLDALADHLTKV